MNEIDEIEEQLCRAIDLLVDNKNSQAERLLEQVISTLRKRISASTLPEEIARCQESWGDALTLMQEPEQALLHYEKGLLALPEDQTLLWKICKTLLNDMERYDEAASILQENLLPLDPENDDYLDALDIARGPQRYKEIEKELEAEEAEEEAEESEDALDHSEFFHGIRDPSQEEEFDDESDDENSSTSLLKP